MFLLEWLVLDMGLLVRLSHTLYRAVLTAHTTRIIRDFQRRWWFPTQFSNHPFYTNSQTLVDSEGRVERFMKKYGLQTKDN